MNKLNNNYFFTLSVAVILGFSFIIVTNLNQKIFTDGQMSSNIFPAIYFGKFYNCK